MFRSVISGAPSLHKLSAATAALLSLFVVVVVVVRRPQLRILLDAMPAPVEAAALKGYRGAPEGLPAEERFARALALCPRLGAKVRVAL